MFRKLENYTALQPDWPGSARVSSRVSSRVSALVTTRLGGFSQPPWDGFNLAGHVGDDAAHVNANRQILSRSLPDDITLQWLSQVHGTRVLDTAVAGLDPKEAPEADAIIIRKPGEGAAVMTADCLPVFLAHRDGHCAAVAHAGWRGLQAGILENLVEQMATCSDDLIAWLGPAIGPCHFEVGDEVRQAFVDADTGGASAAACFTAAGEQGKWMADLYALAALRLSNMGVNAIAGGDCCTCCDATHFYSYRRDGCTGRMASLIWLNNC